MNLSIGALIEVSWALRLGSLEFSLISDMSTLLSGNRGDLSETGMVWLMAKDLDLACPNYTVLFKVVLELFFDKVLGGEPFSSLVPRLFSDG